MPKLRVFREPRVVTGARLPVPEEKRVVLGIDPGTSTGIAYAYVTPGEPIVPEEVPIVVGQWDLSAHDIGDSGALRFHKLRSFLSALGPDLIGYERVRNTPVVPPGKSMAFVLSRVMTAAELLGCYMGTIGGWAEERNVPSGGVEIAAIKRRATGRGNAGKEDVIRAANDLWGFDFDPDTYKQTGVDNMCDAAFCLLLTLEQYSDGFDQARDPRRAAGDEPPGAARPGADGMVVGPGARGPAVA